MTVINEVEKWQGKKISKENAKDKVLFTQTDCIGVEVGDYNVTIWKPDAIHNGHEVGLFQLDKFDENGEPICSKFYYYKDGFDVPTVFAKLDRIWMQRVGSWIN